MRMLELYRYVLRDVVHSRTSPEVILGTLIILTSALALTTINGLSESSKRALDFILESQRTTISTVLVERKDGGVFTKSDFRLLQGLTCDTCLSKVAEGFVKLNMDFRDSDGLTVWYNPDTEPHGAAVPYGDRLLEEGFGGVYCAGGPFARPSQSAGDVAQRPRLGVVARYDYLRKLGYITGFGQFQRHESGTTSKWIPDRRSGKTAATFQAIPQDNIDSNRLYSRPIDLSSTRAPVLIFESLSRPGDHKLEVLISRNFAGYPNDSAGADWSPLAWNAAGAIDGDWQVSHPISLSNFKDTNAVRIAFRVSDGPVVSEVIWAITNVQIIDGDKVIMQEDFSPESDCGRTKGLKLEFPSYAHEELKSGGIPLGVTELPIVGVIKTVASSYPNLLFPPEFAVAYRSQPDGQWDSSFVVQFVRYDNGAPLVPFRHVRSDLEKGCLLDLASNVCEAANPDFLERARGGCLLDTRNREFLFCLADHYQPQDVIRRSQLHFTSLPLAPRLSDTFLAITRTWLWVDDYKKQWRKRDQLADQIRQDYGDQFLVIGDEGAKIIQSLQRVSVLLRNYVESSRAVVWMLTVLAVMVFGFGYVYRKRQDIGLMKSFGTHWSKIVAIFLGQVVAVCLAALILAVVLATLGRSYWESLVGNLLQSILNDPDLSALLGSVDPDQWTRISMGTLLAASRDILLSSLAGGIPPGIAILLVKPIEQLRVHL